MSFIPEISIAAERHNLPMALVSAIAMKESSHIPWAWNPEPKWRWFWNVKTNKAFRTVTDSEVRSQVPPSDFPSFAGDPDQEWWAQQASWGLMQVMGAVAREYGYPEPYLPRLCEPTHSLEYGCRHLAALSKRYLADYGWTGVIASYNAGFPRLTALKNAFVNQDYVDSVMKLTDGQLK